MIYFYIIGGAILYVLLGYLTVYLVAKFKPSHVADESDVLLWPIPAVVFGYEALFVRIPAMIARKAKGR